MKFTRFLLWSLAPLFLFLFGGCDSAVINDTPSEQHYSRFTVSFRNIHINYTSSGITTPAFAAGDFNEHILTHSQWSYSDSLNRIAYDSTWSSMGNGAYGTSYNKSALTIQRIGPSIYEFTFNNSIQSEYGIMHGNYSKSNNNCSLSLSPVTIESFTPDSVVFSWTGAKLEQVLQSFATDHSSSSDASWIASMLSPQTDSSSMTITLYR